MQVCQRLQSGARFLLPLFLFLTMLGIDVSAQAVRLRGAITPQCTATSQSQKFADIFAEGNIAVQGSYSCRGAFIYDISNPDAPVLASWYNPGNNRQFLEAVIVGNKGYFGSGNGGGVHIVDLSNPYNPVLLGIVSPANGNGYTSIHEMVVFEQNGATILITNYNGFSNQILKIINVTNPAAAVWIRDLDPTEPDWVHAMVVKNNRLYTSGWGSGSGQFAGRTEIYDVTNITTQAPVLLGYIADLSGNGNAMHSAWPNEDGTYLYSCRENNDGDADVRVYDITNPATPILRNSLTMQGLGLNAVSPHNPVVKGNYLYVSWYQAGIQVFDISSPANPVRVGQYDTYQSEYAEVPQNKRSVQTTEPWDMICGSESMQNTLPGSWDGAWAVFPGLGEDKVLGGDLATGLWILDVRGIAAAQRNQVSDFDGDHRTDISVFTPATGTWNIEFSSSGSDFSRHWGEPGDIIVGGDYDGDGISDLAIFRPSTAWWHVRLSAGGEINIPFGVGTDVPVPADYDADGRMDIAVWRPSTGVWYIRQSTLGLRAVRWGISTDKPITGDYEGDGKADIAVWRPSNGVWYILQSSSSIPMFRAFGTNGDKPLFADFDGNGTSDLAVYRPSDGNWYILDPATNVFRALNWGLAEDIPVPGDYDGDGSADIAVFRPGTNMWYRLDSSSGAFHAQAFGQAGDRPSPSSVNPQ
jgi:hypothetical protein